MRFLGQVLRLLILDLDGVVLDLMAVFARNLKRTAGQMGLSVKLVDEYLAGVRTGEKRGGRVLDWPQIIWPELSRQEVKDFVRYFREEEETKPYMPITGSAEAIEWFRARIPVAICTSNERENTLWRMRSAGINPHWFTIINTLDNEHFKPDPQALLWIVRRAEVKLSETIYVGDWYPDIEMAKKAGVPFVAVMSGALPEHAFIREGVSPERIFETLKDFWKQVQKDSS